MQTPKGPPSPPAGFGARLDNHAGDESPTGFPIPAEQEQALAQVEQGEEIIDAEVIEHRPQPSPPTSLTHWSCPSCKSTNPRKIVVQGQPMELSRCLACGELRPGNPAAVG